MQGWASLVPSGFWSPQRFPFSRIVMKRGISRAFDWQAKRSASGTSQSSPKCRSQAEPRTTTSKPPSFPGPKTAADLPNPPSNFKSDIPPARVCYQPGTLAPFFLQTQMVQLHNCLKGRVCNDRPSPNQLYFGDNLEILRQHIADESVDLIYLDPPFNPAAALKAGGALD